MKLSHLLVILLAVSLVYSQEISKVHFKNGDMVKGQIIETVPDQYIRVEMKDGSIMTFQLEDVTRIESIPIAKQGSMGLGLGIPYGIFGANIDYAVNETISFSGGIGTSIFAGPAYNFGIKIYLKGVGHKSRPRVSAYYGVNATILVIDELTDEFLVEETHHGLSVGIGQQWMWGDRKNKGLDVDLILLASSTYHDRAVEVEEEYGTTLTETGNIKLSIGYRFGF
jgi:hypothetical protein